MSTPRSALDRPETRSNVGLLGASDTSGSSLDRPEVENTQRAMLNILEDFAADKNVLESGRRAMLNILDDFDSEKARMEGTQRAALNILDDSMAEKTQLEATQRSMLNILDDFASEKMQLESAQGAMVNILDDFAEEKASLEETQRAVLNILDDFETEKNKVGLANQELTRSNTELQQFAYVASHDLQEPLRMVASFTQLLAQRYQGKLGADADEFIGYAVDGALRMQVLVNDLLAYTRVGTRGKEFAAVDCERVLQTVLANLQKTLEESGGQVTHDPLPTLQGDETQLWQVLQNLVGNALKFHGSEPPRVHVSAQQIQGEWRFSVRDNGIGINPEHAERIFLLFQRLHTRAEFPGTGMGLAITKKIVERHDGRIWVESEPGKGSTFYFSLPMKGVTHGNELRASAAG